MKFIFTFDDFIITFLILLSIVILPIVQLNYISTYVLIPVAFIYFLKKNNFKIPIDNKTLKYFIYFFIWSTLVSIQSIDFIQAFITQKKMLLVLLYSLTLFLYLQTRNGTIKIIYWAHILSLGIIFIYTLVLNNTHSIDETNRLTESGLNANTYGYYCFLGLSSLFLVYGDSKKGIFLKALIILFSILSLYLMLLSASRGGFVIILLTIIINIATILVINKTKKFRIVALLVIGSILLVGGYYVYSLYLQDSYLASRFLLIESTGTPRIYHFKKAVEIGVDNPFFGVGGGNYAVIPKEIEQGSFSHSSFPEAFANYGFPGIVLLLLVYISFLKTVNRIYKKSNHFKLVTYTSYCFASLFILYNFIYVTYLTIFFMGFYIAVHSHLHSIYKQHLQS